MIEITPLIGLELFFLGIIVGVIIIMIYFDLRIKKIKINPENRAFCCSNIEDSYCKVIKHMITNGHASEHHCGNCNKFKLTRCDIKKGSRK